MGLTWYLTRVTQVEIDPGERLRWVLLPAHHTWTASRFQVVERAGMVKTAKGAEDFCLRSGER